MRRPLTLLILAFVLCAGCAALSNDNAEPTYASDAEANMKLGNDAYNNKLFNEAEKYYEFIKTKYPYLEVAKAAELRLGDTDFAREHWTEARDRYTNFVKLHPTHPRVDYAAFRAALTHYKDIPYDFFIVPPSYEKEQTEVKAALKAMEEFQRLYPNSSFLAQAKETVDDCKRRLAQHELYVADFYAKRKRWLAVVGRLNTVAQDFAGIGYDERALMGLYNAYSQLHDDARAKDSLRKLISEMPGTPAAQKAQKLLGS